MKKGGLILVFVVMCMACEQEKQDILPADSVIGTWTGPVYSDSTRAYTRSEEMPEDAYALSLRADHSVVERKNSGWCGTPPISYADFDGTWTKTGDTLSISVGFWGGTSELIWEILSVDQDKMIIRVIGESFPLNENPPS